MWKIYECCFYSFWMCSTELNFFKNLKGFFAKRPELAWSWHASPFARGMRRGKHRAPDFNHSDEAQVWQGWCHGPEGQVHAGGLVELSGKLKVEWRIRWFDVSAPDPQTCRQRPLLSTRFLPTIFFSNYTPQLRHPLSWLEVNSHLHKEPSAVVFQFQPKVANSKNQNPLLLFYSAISGRWCYKYSSLSVTSNRD